MDSLSSGCDGRPRLQGKHGNAWLLAVCWFLEDEGEQGLKTHCQFLPLG